ncbi:MAG TPA: PQQ-binding-like beta-propeller repeat protein [Chthoniobacteraceae bacterium]|jgi:outer membrane protein assembly factor BamB|nr:PQQ-binding-like beta-propeller repeat protein [Chthoniobacteraceae bacterium]
MNKSHLLPVWTILLAGLLTAGEPAVPATTGWRGNGTGVYADAKAPLEWGDAQNMRWRVKVGHAYSTPVIAGDAVLVTSEPSNIVCLSLDNGVVRWKASLKAADAPAAFQEKALAGEDAPSACGYAAPTPVCDGRDGFFVFGSGLIACFSLDGQRKWVQHLEPLGGTFGHSSSPLLIGRTLLVNVHHLTALNADTGQILWECAEAGHTYGTPAVMNLGGTAVVVTPLGKVVRVSDGRVLAAGLAPDLGGSEFGISPTASGDLVYLGDRTITALQLSLDGEAVHAQTVWTAHPDVNAFASPVVWNGLLFFVGKAGDCFVLDAKTGEKLLEGKLKIGPAEADESDSDSASVYPSLVIADGKLLVGNDKGQTVVYEATRELKEVARNRLKDGSGATPVFTNSSILLRAGNWLCAVGK